MRAFKYTCEKIDLYKGNINRKGGGKNKKETRVD